MTTVFNLAKQVFQLHSADAQDKTVLRKQVAPFFAKLPPCLIGMEARRSAHKWI